MTIKKQCEVAMEDEVFEKLDEYLFNKDRHEELKD